MYASSFVHPETTRATTAMMTTRGCSHSPGNWFSSQPKPAANQVLGGNNGDGDA